MKTLIEAVELWIDSKVESNIRPWLKDMEDIHIRDANRIAELDRRLQLYLDSPSPEADAGESMYEADQMLSELDTRLDDVDSRLDDLECSVEEKVDSCDVDDKVESAIEDIDIPDSYAIEVMIDDALETKVMDAVRAELDATDFKITVER